MARTWMTFATTSLRAQLRLWRDVVPPRPSGTSQAVSPDARGGSDAPHLGRTRRASVLRHRRARRQWSASVADLEAWSQDEPQPTAKTAHDRPGFVLGLNRRQSTPLPGACFPRPLVRPLCCGTKEKDSRNVQINIRQKGSLDDHWS